MEERKFDVEDFRIQDEEPDVAAPGLLTAFSIATASTFVTELTTAKLLT